MIRILGSNCSIINDNISQFQQMISSISRKHKIIANNPHMIVFSSAQAASDISLNQHLPALQTDRNTLRNEVKPFKIRAFAIRGSSSVKQPRIEGKKIVAEAIECIKQQSYSRKERRPSVQIIRKARENISEDASLAFADLQIHEVKQSSSLTFSQFDNSSLSNLSYSPSIWINQNYLRREKEILLIISTNILSLDSKKRPKSNQKNYHSQKSVGSINQQHQYSDQTQNILRNIGRGQGIFGNCRTFIKSSCLSQINELKQFIQQHKLNHIEGLINIRSKLTDTHNIYSLRQIVSNNERLLIMQDQEILQTQIPLVQNLQTLFLTFKSKSSNLLSFNKFLHIIKQSKISGFNNNPTKQEESKENMNPNIMYARSSKKQSFIKKPIYPVITISSTLKQSWAEINYEQIVAKIMHNKQSKKIKLTLRQRRSLSANQSLQQKNNSKEKQANEKWHRDQGLLQGDFKQKMIKYVKILEHQKLSIKPRQRNNWRQKEQRLDDIQEITMNVTSKLKSKTSYQLVGDLIRLNAHTSRQIQKYQASITPFTKGMDPKLRDYSLSQSLKLISQEEIRNKQLKVQQVRQKFITYSFN